MNRYREAWAAGQEMPSERVEPTLESLTRDERWPVVLRWLEANRASWAAAAGDPNAAREPGRLAHTCGAMHACELLLGQMARLMGADAAGGPEEPEE